MGNETGRERHPIEGALSTKLPVGELELNPNGELWETVMRASELSCPRKEGHGTFTH